MKVMEVLHANLEVLRAVTPKSQVVWDVTLRLGCDAASLYEWLLY